MLKKILNLLLQVLTLGKSAGLFTEKPGVPQPPGTSPFDNTPHQPGTKPR